MESGRGWPAGFSSASSGRRAALQRLLRLAYNLMQWIYEEFGVSVSNDRVNRIVKNQRFAHLSARPRAYKQNKEALAVFRKTSRTNWRRSGKVSTQECRSKSGSMTR